MKWLAVFTMLALFAAVGCEKPSKPIRRFEPVTGPDHEGIALDTATGLLCRTWNWHYNANAPDEAKGGLDDLRACYELYKEDPIDLPSHF